MKNQARIFGLRKVLILPGNKVTDKKFQTMFTDISWSSYIITVIILLAGYYLFIGFRYYRNDLLQSLSGKKISPDEASFKAPQKSHKENLLEAFEKQNFFQLSQSAADEIQAFIHQAGSDKLNADEVMKGIRALLGKYPGLKDSPFCELIENLIISECEMNCSIPLDAEQARALWL
jgi:hypothetical protein